MRYFSLLVWVFCLTLSSCERSTSKSLLVWQEIAGRDNQPESGVIARYPLYRIKVPKEWKRIDPDPNVSIADTTLPLVTYFIDTPQGEIKFVIHHFPPIASKQGIPPFAQIERWKRQFTELDDTHYSLTAQAYAGFIGWKFEAEGIIQNFSSSMLAWALELAPEHQRKIIPIGTNEEKRYAQQMKADVTLKFTGPSDAITMQHDILNGVARSFELIPDLDGVP